MTSSEKKATCKGATVGLRLTVLLALCTTPLSASAGEPWDCEQLQCNDFNACSIDTCDPEVGCINQNIIGLPCVPGPAGDALCQSGGNEFACCDAITMTCDCPQGILFPDWLNSLCATVRSCSTENAVSEGCALGYTDSESCGFLGPDLQCSDAGDPWQGICVDECCYESTQPVIIDIWFGPHHPGCGQVSQPVCGAEVHLRYDRQVLDLQSIVTDPDDVGWTQTDLSDIDENAGTVDLILGLPPETPCTSSTGVWTGATIARLSFTPLLNAPSWGVAFRNHEPASHLIGPSGPLFFAGCGGAAQPSPTQEMVIAEDCANIPDHPAIPAASPAGLIVLAALLMIGMVAVSRRRGVQVG